MTTGSVRRTVVATTTGPVAGVEADGVHRFLGIPYAAAPIGPRQLRLPQPHQPWSEPRDASSFGATAPLAEGVSPGGLPVVPEPVVAGDDYLNLNVWTRTPGSAERTPVLVWIHGGGFFAGCSANPWYDGVPFARDGVVFVSINYRLGAEGFAAVSGAPRNRAVLDWIAALTWIRDNAAAFGGDPASVTIMGQSAGGMAVATLLACAEARGLFHRAIIASGISDSATVSLERARSVASDLASVLGVRDDLDDMAGLTSAELVRGQVRLEAARGGGSGAPSLETAEDASVLLWAPVVDGDLVRGPLSDRESMRLSDDIPVLVGTTHDEFGWTYTLEDPDDPRGQALADQLFRLPTQHFVDSRSDASAATFRYEFQWRSTAFDGRLGAGHSLDIPFFFDNLAAPYVEDYSGANPPQTIATSMHGAFVRFALTGDPGWPAYRAGEESVRVFDDEVRTETGFVIG